jgi:hypothetical protein
MANYNLKVGTQLHDISKIQLRSFGDQLGERNLKCKHRHYGMYGTLTCTGAVRIS